MKVPMSLTRRIPAAGDDPSDVSGQPAGTRKGRSDKLKAAGGALLSGLSRLGGRRGDAGPDEAATAPDVGRLLSSSYMPVLDNVADRLPAQDLLSLSMANRDLYGALNRGAAQAARIVSGAEHVNSLDKLQQGLGRVEATTETGDPEIPHKRREEPLAALAGSIPNLPREQQQAALNAWRAVAGKWVEKQRADHPERDFTLLEDLVQSSDKHGVKGLGQYPLYPELKAAAVLAVDRGDDEEAIKQRYGIKTQAGQEALVRCIQTRPTDGWERAFPIVINVPPEPPQVGRLRRAFRRG